MKKIMEGWVFKVHVYSKINYGLVLELLTAKTLIITRPSYPKSLELYSSSKFEYVNFARQWYTTVKCLKVLTDRSL